MKKEIVKKISFFSMFFIKYKGYRLKRKKIF